MMVLQGVEPAISDRPLQQERKMATVNRDIPPRVRQLLAEELGERGMSAAELGPAMIRAGAVLSVQINGPAQTLDSLAALLRELTGEFPNAWQVVRTKYPGATPAGWV
jgi:hypothetical protein